jgi:hypothetical protein
MGDRFSKRREIVSFRSSIICQRATNKRATNTRATNTRATNTRATNTRATNTRATNTRATNTRATNTHATNTHATKTRATKTRATRSSRLCPAGTALHPIGFSPGSAAPSGVADCYVSSHWPRVGGAMGFIQIIEYETDRPEEMWALGEARTAEMGEAPPGFRLTVTQDRDNPKRYVTIVEFPSYEVAMENSNDPGTDAFARQMAALCTSGPRFHNLDVKRTVPS